MSDTERRPPISEDELLRLLAKHHAPVTPPEEFERSLRGEAEAEFRRSHDHAQTYSTAKRFGRVTVFRLAGALAAAACILVGLAFWMVERADKGGVRIGQEPRAVTIVAPTQRVAAKPADLPSADCLVYFRAWEKSPDSLDDLLTRDAAVLLRPAPIESGLDGRRFLRTMNPIKEEHNEKHSMRGVASGALV